MKYKISAKNDSVVNAGITTDYRQAIVEYIWNGFDANAQTVRIDYQANEVGCLTDLTITDDGFGINRKNLEQTFGVFLSSQKKRTFQRTSDVNGKKGKGRFSFHDFATSVVWTTRYVDENQVMKQYQITIYVEDLTNYDVSEEIIVDDPTLRTGTEVRFINIVNLYQSYLTSASFTDHIAQKFAWFLCLNKSRHYAIFLNSVEFDYEYLFGNRDEFQLNINESIFDVTYIRWNRKIGDKFYFYMLKGDFTENCKILTSFNNNTIDFYHSIYVTSKYFDNFVFEENPSTRLDGITNQLDATYRLLMKELKKRLTAYESQFAKEISANILIKKFEDKGVLPSFKNTKYDLERKKDLEEAIKNIYIVQPKIFKGLKPAQEKTLVGFLNLLLDSNERDRIISILDGIITLSEEEREQLSNVLRSTTISRINRMVNMMHDRYEVIETLRKLVYDLSKFTNERDHIQKIIEVNYWLFGEQFHMVSHDESFENLISKYLYILDGEDAKPEVIGSEERNRRPDIFMCRQYIHPYLDSNLIEDNVIVELKRPNVEIGVVQYRQIEDYMNLIKNEAQFNSQLRTWKFYVVSKELSKDVKDKYRSFEHFNKRFLVNKVDNYEIYAMSWDDVFKSFELQHNYILEKLGFDKSKIKGEITSVSPTRAGADALTKEIGNLNAN